MAGRRSSVSRRPARRRHPATLRPEQTWHRERVVDLMARLGHAARRQQRAVERLECRVADAAVKKAGGDAASVKLNAAAEAERVLGKGIDREYNLADLLRRPDVSYHGLMSLDEAKYQNQELLGGLSGDDVSRETTRAIIEQIEIAAKYSGYIDRQRDEVERAAHYESLKLPEDLDYNQVSALSIEVRQRLSRQRPETLGQA